jgi:hypothetical protein
MSQEEAALLESIWDEDERRSLEIVRIDRIVFCQDAQTIRAKIVRRNGTRETIEFPASLPGYDKNWTHISHRIWRQL